MTAELARGLGLSGVAVLPMTDQPVETWVQLADGARWVHFQEYFVKELASVPISAVQVRGIEEARPAPGLLEAIADAEVIVLCPSNPFVSLGPILQVAGVREAIRAARRGDAGGRGESRSSAGRRSKGRPRG